MKLCLQNAKFHLNTQLHNKVHSQGDYVLCAYVAYQNNLTNGLLDEHATYEILPPIPSMTRDTHSSSVTFAVDYNSYCRCDTPTDTTKVFLVIKIQKQEGAGLQVAGTTQFEVTHTSKRKATGSKIQLTEPVTTPNYNGQRVITSLTHSQQIGSISLTVSHDNMNEICIQPVEYPYCDSISAKLYKELETVFDLCQSGKCAYKHMYQNTSPEIAANDTRYFNLMQTLPQTCQVDNQVLDNLLKVSMTMHRVDSADLDNASYISKLCVLANSVRLMTTSLRYDSDYNIEGQLTERFLSIFEQIHWCQQNSAYLVGDCEDSAIFAVKLFVAMQNRQCQKQDQLGVFTNIANDFIPILVTSSVNGSHANKLLDSNHKDLCTHTTAIAINNAFLAQLVDNGNKCKDLLDAHSILVQTSIDSLNLSPHFRNSDGKPLTFLLEGTGIISSNLEAELPDASPQVQFKMQELLRQFTKQYGNTADFTCVMNMHNINFYQYAITLLIGDSKFACVDMNSQCLGIKFYDLLDTESLQNIGLIRLEHDFDDHEVQLMKHRLALQYPIVPIQQSSCNSIEQTISQLNHCMQNDSTDKTELAIIRGQLHNHHKSNMTKIQPTEAKADKRSMTAIHLDLCSNMSSCLFHF